HHSEHWTERLKTYKAAFRVCLNQLISEVSLRVLRVVTAYPCALLSLSDCGFDRFTHLSRHHPAELKLFVFQDFTSPKHLLRTLLKGCESERAKSVERSLNLRFD